MLRLFEFLFSGRFSTCQAFQIINVVRNTDHSPTVRISGHHHKSKLRPFYFSDNRSNSHSYDWGTGGKLRHKRPRPEFRGEFGLNPITGRDEVHVLPQREIHKWRHANSGKVVSDFVTQGIVWQRGEGGHFCVTSLKYALFWHSPVTL